MKKKNVDEELLEGIESLARNLSLAIRYEKGSFHGGLCRVEDQQAFIINKDLSTSEKIKVFARELADMDLEGIYILPAIRERIEDEKTN